MKKILSIVNPDEIVDKFVELAKDYPLSFFGGLRNRNLFASAETYCMFIGYPRSGHSLIGSLLDAHPNMVVAHELNTLKYLYAGFKKNQLCYLILRNSRLFTEKGRVWSGYSYRVPGQWQGRFNRLQVLGDKKGYGTSLLLKSYPVLLDRLRTTLNLRLKLIHVMRNPFDNISTMSIKGKRTLAESIELYFSLAETVARFRDKVDRNDFYELRHESFIDDPRRHLGELCAFLGVDATESYLKDCSEIVFNSPSKTRFAAPWNAGLIAAVEEKMARFSFFEGYAYAD